MDWALFCFFHGDNFIRYSCLVENGVTSNFTSDNTPASFKGEQ